MGVKHLWLAIGTACAFQPAQAADEPPTGVWLWGGLRAGMTKAEATAAQPSRTVTLSDACTGHLFFSFDKQGGLKEVEMDSAKGGIAQRCPEIVLNSLIKKYGPADDEQHPVTPGADCGYGTKVANLCRAMGLEKAISSSTYAWNVLGLVVVRFKIVDGSPNWAVTYGLMPVPLPNAADKL